MFSGETGPFLDFAIVGDGFGVGRRGRRRLLDFEEDRLSAMQIL